MISSASWPTSKRRGIQLINEEPRLGDDGRQYAFVHPKSAHGVMIELYELPVRRKGQFMNCPLRV